VITYDVVVTVANPDLLLKPGMTATAKIATAQAQNVLRVPSQALRFTPTVAAKAGGAKAGGARTGAARLSGRGQRSVWVLRAGKPVKVSVTVGLDDDANAEIRSGDLNVGDQVITGQVAAGAAATGRPAGSGAPPTASLRL
jgi:HlyD family secretion protein